jgi:hypothetical protein
MPMEASCEHFPLGVPSPTASGRATLRVVAARCASCGPPRGLSMHCASDHAIPGDAPVARARVLEQSVRR